MHTIADLEAARVALAMWQERFANDSSNNPGKYQADIRAAAEEVARIESSLKASGVIPLTDAEQRDQRLDAAFPGARSRQIVTFEGKQYQRRFAPTRMSNSRKSVTKWDKWWEETSGTS